MRMAGRILANVISSSADGNVRPFITLRRRSEDDDVVEEGIKNGEFIKVQKPSGMRCSTQCMGSAGHSVYHWCMRQP